MIIKQSHFKWAALRLMTMFGAVVVSQGKIIQILTSPPAKARGF